MMDQAAATAVESFLVKLDACIAAEQGFTLIIDDPAGVHLLNALSPEYGQDLNSKVYPQQDPYRTLTPCSICKFPRNFFLPEQKRALSTCPF